MAIVFTILITIGCSFLLYYFFRLLAKHKNIIYSGERNRALECNIEGIRLKGKPDYIRRQENNYVPYEYKSLKIKANGAYLDHKLQLACYMRLTESSFGKKPDYGIIVYGNKRSFKVANTLGLQKELDKRINRLKELKTNRTKPIRNHHIRLKCAACRHYSVCGERL